MTYDLNTKVCIVGAGPSGATASMFLSKHGIPHVLLDKAAFPRDKVCGDGLTIEVMNTLIRFNPSIVEEMIALPDTFLPSWGVKGYAPNGKCMHVPFSENALPFAPFYTAKRKDFDHFLLKHVGSEYATVLLNTKVTKIERSDQQLNIQAIQHDKKLSIQTPLVLGADGERSIVNRIMGSGNYKIPEFTYASVRTYFSGVEGTGKGNELEFYFFKDILPGYFWIFPLPNGITNVGVIMLGKHIKTREVNLKKKFWEFIEQKPELQERFKNAEPIQKLAGWGLPLNTHQKNLAGDNYLLLGDAGALIEPFSGKGIGKAMVSGRIAADIASKAIESQRFDASFLQDYHNTIYRQHREQWKWLARFQRWYHSPLFVNAFTATYNIGILKKITLKKSHEEAKKWMKY